MFRLRLMTAASLGLLIAACSDADVVGQEQDQFRAKAPPAAPAPAVAAAPAPAPPSANPAAKAIDAAAFAEAPATPLAGRDLLIRAQVLLDRARFAPGVIDGQAGENVRQAIAAFEAAKGLPVDGKLDAEVYAALTAEDGAPAMQDYVITEADVAGPFVEKIPTDMEEMAKLERLAFTSPAEALAEKFHMDEKLLRALNPGADFAKPGTTILVARPGAAELPAKVARIEVDKAEKELRAYDAAGVLLAVYPATVGSSDMPAPSGEWEVATVAPDPTYTYDPSRLTFGKANAKLTIAAGPNNPVGGTWIDLTKDTYGIHGTPEPSKVGKVDSHGCVRLTNWDAARLAKAVEKGTKVVFVGTEGAKA
ncbi:MAG TPA: L,D-transpeptidase [Phenylobacterium sp.]|nr:L,D-transpeptidase [Phenylobacterium sp.]